MVFPVVMYGCETWTVKKAEHQGINVFELWCWRRLLTVPWTEKRFNQSILKEISPEYSLEGLMLNLKLQYLGQLMRRAVSFEKTLILRKIEGRRRRGNRGWDCGCHHQLNEHEFEWTLGVGDGHGGLTCWSQWGLKELDLTERLSWTELKTHTHTHTHTHIHLSIWSPSQIIAWSWWRGF